MCLSVLMARRARRMIVGAARDPLSASCALFSAALPRLQQVATAQSENRINALTDLAAAAEKADLTTGSPCLFCLHTLGKTPWSSLSPTASPIANDRSLPVLR